MEIEGGCYCGELRYQVAGDPMYKVLCYCKECQIIAGGAPATIIGMPRDNFSYTQGTPTVMRRNRNPEMPGVREFCGTCGTHILSTSENHPKVVSLKVGTMDNPADFIKADSAVQLAEKQPYHQPPDNVEKFERWL